MQQLNRLARSCAFDRLLVVFVVVLVLVAIIR